MTHMKGLPGSLIVIRRFLGEFQNSRVSETYILGSRNGGHHHWIEIQPHWRKVERYTNITLRKKLKIFNRYIIKIFVK